LFLLLCLLSIPACRTLETNEYAPGDMPPPDPDRRIVAVTRASGARVTFDRGSVDTPELPAPRIEDGAVVGSVAGEPVRVDLADTRSVWIEELKGARVRTLLLIGGVILGATMLIPGAWGL
jgi:hypothetical protein